MRVLRAVFGLLVTCPLALAAAAAWLVPAPQWRNRRIHAVARTWARLLLRLLRVRVRLLPPGLTETGAALYVSNHTGYLDTLVMTALVPGSFISREGIPWWPVIGQVIAISGAVFLDRRNRFSIGRSMEKVRRKLRAGTRVLFYPEGTSSNGEALLPFRSAVFAAATGRHGERFPVRPLLIWYRTVGGEPITPANRDRVYWYGDMTLPRHVWGMLSAPGIEVDVKALPERYVVGRRQEFAEELCAEMQRELRALTDASPSSGADAPDSP